MPCNPNNEIGSWVIIAAIVAIIALFILTGCDCKPGSDAITKTVCDYEK